MVFVPFFLRIKIIIVYLASDKIKTHIISGYATGAAT